MDRAQSYELKKMYRDARLTFSKNVRAVKPKIEVKDKLKFYKRDRFFSLDEISKKYEETRENLKGKNFYEITNKLSFPKGNRNLNDTLSTLNTNCKTFFNTSMMSLNKSGFISKDNLKTLNVPNRNKNKLNLDLDQKEIKKKLDELKKNKKDHELMKTFYSRGHDIINENKRLKLNESEKEELFKKYSINEGINVLEKEKIFNDLRLKENSKSQYISINEYLFYDPIRSYQQIKVNKQLFNNINSIIEEEQQYKYGEILSKVIKDQNKVNKVKSVKSLYFPKVERKMVMIQEQAKTLDEDKESFFEETALNQISRELLLSKHNYIILNKFRTYKSQPCSRSKTNIVVNLDLDNIYLFGGLNGEKLNDLWQCDVSNNKYLWKKINPTGSIPRPRLGNSMVFYKNRLVIYGGVAEDDDGRPELQDDMILFDLTTNKFIQEFPNQSTHRTRKNHIAHVIGDSMVIHGGQDSNGNVLCDIAVFDFSRFKWIPNDYKNPKVPGFTNHSSCLVLSYAKSRQIKMSVFKQPDIPFYSMEKIKLKNEGIFIFGGMDEDDQYSNQIHLIRIYSDPLKIVKINTQGLQPIARSGCSMTFFEHLNVIVIHGGRNDKYKGGIYFSDYWMLDLENFTWIGLNIYQGIQKCPDEPRADHQAFINRSKLVILGGHNGTQFVGSDFLIGDLDLYSSSKYIQFWANKVKFLQEKEQLDQNITTNSPKKEAKKQNSDTGLLKDSKIAFTSFLQKCDELKLKRIKLLRGEN